MPTEQNPTPCDHFPDAGKMVQQSTTDTRSPEEVLAQALADERMRFSFPDRPGVVTREDRRQAMRLTKALRAAGWRVLR